MHHISLSALVLKDIILWIGLSPRPPNNSGASQKPKHDQRIVLLAINLDGSLKVYFLPDLFKAVSPIILLRG